MKRFVVIGGGAAGFFAAINAAELHKNLEVIIVEGSQNVLQKVKVSGGGRCNVTNGCFTPNDLVNFYPRGRKELLGPFHKFMTGDTMEWFENRGVSLKIEDDNRVFPTSNSSESIINCFQESAKKIGVKVHKSTRVEQVLKTGNSYKIITNKFTIEANYVLMATGSNHKAWEIIKNLSHTVIKPVPSLFTFNITNANFKAIPGVSVPNANVKIKNTKLIEQGPLLITHWGFSGPAILKLSAWGARELNNLNYKFEVEINWLNLPFSAILNEISSYKNENAKKVVGKKPVFIKISKRLWEVLLNEAHVNATLQWAQISKKQLEAIAKQLTETTVNVTNKSTFKDEFVTAGGVDLKEIDFTKFESKIHKNLFFAGEVLNIDAVTGGFNFQNAWTGGWIVANSLKS